jgi:hypothetical protein
MSGMSRSSRKTKGNKMHQTGSGFCMLLIVFSVSSSAISVARCTSCQTQDLPSATRSAAENFWCSDTYSSTTLDSACILRVEEMQVQLRLSVAGVSGRHVHLEGLCCFAPQGINPANDQLDVTHRI